MNGSFARINLPMPIGNATYDIANRLTNWNGQTFTYDDNGNLLSDGERTYTWNVRDQLIRITGPVNATFQYDSFWRRKQKIINSARTDFIYDGWNFVQEKDNATVKANLLTGLGLDELYSRTQGANASYFLPDALGGALGLADNTGTIQTHYSYAPYGETTQTGAANENSQKFTGREDDGTGLYHYRYRYYLPTCGRFIAEDPIGLTGGLNLYGYVGGNPISAKDPTGQAFVIPIIIGVGIVWAVWQIYDSYKGGKAVGIAACGALNDMQDFRDISQKMGERGVSDPNQDFKDLAEMQQKQMDAFNKINNAMGGVVEANGRAQRAIPPAMAGSRGSAATGSANMAGFAVGVGLGTGGGGGCGK